MSRHRSRCSACQCKPKSNWTKKKLREKLNSQIEEFFLDKQEDEEYQRELQWMEFDEDLYEDSVFQNLIDLSEGKCKHPYYWETIDWESRRSRLNRDK